MENRKIMNEFDLHSFPELKTKQGRVEFLKLRKKKVLSIREFGLKPIIMIGVNNLELKWRDEDMIYRLTGDCDFQYR